ncbi:MAG: hypothetical protein V4760_07025, partial [Bdellovibrionota bacterium]
SEAEASKYILSPAFLKDAERSRLKDLFESTESEGSVRSDRERVGQQWVGVIESDFTIDERAVLMSERVWVRHGLLFHFLIASRGVMTPSSESHKQIFAEFKNDFALGTKQTSLIDLFIDEARAETVRPTARPSSAPVGRPAAQSARPGPAPVPANCRDRGTLLNIEQAKLRIGPPAVRPAFSIANCGEGARRAVNEMKNSILRVWGELEQQTNMYIAQQGCAELAPSTSRPRNGSLWANIVESMGNAGAAEAYSECLSAASTRAAAGMAGRAIGRAATGIANMATASATYVATGGPARTARSFYDFLKAGGRPEEVIFRYIANKVTGFTCLTDAEQTRVACATATNIGAEVAVAVATGGTVAVATRAVRIGMAIDKVVDRTSSSLRIVVVQVNRPGSPNTAPRPVSGPATRPASNSTTPRNSGTAQNSQPRPAPAAAPRRNGDGESTAASGGQGPSRQEPAPQTPGPAASIARSPTEVLVSREQMAALETASQRRIGTRTVSALSATSPGQQLVVRVTANGRPETSTRTVSREEAIRLASDPTVDGFHIEGIRPMGATPRLSAAQGRKLTPESTTMISTWSPEAVGQVMVTFRSGEVGIFTGNRQMITAMAAREDVTGIELRNDPPGWIRPTYGLDAANRNTLNPTDRMRSELAAGSAINQGRALGYGDTVVFHGTVRENVESVRGGPRNVGAGFGGRGLYVALEGDRDLAENYSSMASQAAENRVANVSNNVDPTTIDRTPVVMRGRLNPDRNFRVGVFEIGRNIFEPDLRNGRLPPNWDEDPRLRALVESEFDVIEIRNARANGMNISSDRYLVVHERAGADAVVWQRTDRTNPPPRAPAQPALTVNFQNVQTAADSWRENQVPSRNYLPRLNVVERQQYAARVLSTPNLSTRQVSGFQRSARDFKPEFWNDPAQMATYRASTTESLRRSGFTDPQIETLFESGAITGARPRP